MLKLIAQVGEVFAGLRLAQSRFPGLPALCSGVGAVLGVSDVSVPATELVEVSPQGLAAMDGGQLGHAAPPVQGPYAHLEHDPWPLPCEGAWPRPLGIGVLLACSAFAEPLLSPGGGRGLAIPNWRAEGMDRGPGAPGSNLLASRSDSFIEMGLAGGRRGVAARPTCQRGRCYRGWLFLQSYPQGAIPSAFSIFYFI